MITYLPVSKARAKLTTLLTQVKEKQAIYLTTNGEVSAVLVDPKYLQQLEADVKKIFKKTYIDPTLDKYTRDFSDEEIAQWLEDDKL